MDDEVNTRTKQSVYLIKWKGYSEEDNTWEPKQNLNHAADLLKEYEANKKKPAPKKTAPKKAVPKKAAAKKAAAPKKKAAASPKKKAAPAKAAGRASCRGPGRPKKQ